MAAQNKSKSKPLSGSASNQIFGTSGKKVSPGYQDFSEKEKLVLISHSSGFINLKTTGFSKIDSFRPNLEREFSDKYKGSEISMRILAFKTAETIDHSIAMPRRMFFTTKFYTFKEIKTENAILT